MEVLNEEYSLAGLFISAFVSSTILPGSSEIVLTALAAQGEISRWNLLLVATLGNTLGGMSSWGLGWIISWRFPLTELSKPAHRKAVDRLREWGSPLLLLSWVPIMGDPLCIAAGWLRLSGVRAFLFIGSGKALRYALLLALLPTEWN